ncbi:MAG: glycosyltransferase family 4 protein, partial [Firmicutes bacterium]|nr:glycosyltransferase family 4 protein [Bacillota bacterium]
MMHIVFDAQPLVDNGKTGVGYCEAGIVTALQSQYTEHDYMFNYFAFRDAREKAGRLRQFVRGDSRSRVCAWFDESLYRILWNFVPVPYRWFFGKSAQITHFFNYHVPPGVPGKTVATVHDMSYKAFPETVRFKTRFMLNLSLRRSCRRADKILTDSEFSKAEIIKYLKLSEDKLVVCPCGVDHRMYRPSADRQEIARIKEKYGIHGDYFLYLGMLEPRKNIERLLEAYAILKKERPDAAALVLAGRKGWLYDSIFTRASALELNDNVLFTGYVDDGDKPP